MTSKAESHDDMAEAERLGAALAKQRAGMVSIPAALVGRGGIHDTAWITRGEAVELADGLRTLWLLGS